MRPGLPRVEDAARHPTGADEPPLGGVGLLGRAIDNSQVVREVDPRSARESWSWLLLVCALVGALGLYAWPHLELREVGSATARLARERDRLREENRKLRLEKATLENLQRVEAIATRQLGLGEPSPQRTVVVERPRAAIAAAPSPASKPSGD